MHIIYSSSSDLLIRCPTSAAVAVSEKNYFDEEEASEEEIKSLGCLGIGVLSFLVLLLLALVALHFFETH